MDKCTAIGGRLISLLYKLGSHIKKFGDEERRIAGQSSREADVTGPPARGFSSQQRCPSFALDGPSRR